MVFIVTVLFKETAHMVWDWTRLKLELGAQSLSPGRVAGTQLLGPPSVASQSRGRKLDAEAGLRLRQKRSGGERAAAHRAGPGPAPRLCVLQQEAHSVSSSHQ